MEIVCAILFWIVGPIFGFSTGGIGFILMFFGFGVGAIAKSKGRPFWGWTLWGFALAIVALPHVLLVKRIDDGSDSLRIDGSIMGIAYRKNDNGSVTAELNGKFLKFGSLEALSDFAKQR